MRFKGTMNMYNDQKLAYDVVYTFILFSYDYSNSPSEILRGFSAHLYSDGAVYYHPSTKIEADCSLDLKDYPNDTQVRTVRS